MLHDISLPSLEMLLIVGRGLALAAALLVFAVALRRWRQASVRDTQRVFAQLDLLRADLHALRDQQMPRAATGAAPVRTAAASPPAPMRDPWSASSAPVAVSGPARGYEIAVRMARSGASKEELMQTCGIGVHEAELLIKLHGKKTPRNDVPHQPAAQPRAAAQGRSRLVAIG